MKRRSPRSAKRLLPESLEPRLMLTSDGGIVGADARLTLSFAPDGTDVGGQSSALFAQMDSIGVRPLGRGLGPRPVAVTNESLWQDAILDGFQTWASLINGDIGQVADDGSDFGVPGRNRHDPRFGDIRIGSIPFDDAEGDYAVAFSTAQVIEGTWTGDVLFNSNRVFASVDEVFAVALHEAGHVLGLEHTEDPLSPMFGHGIPTSTTPTTDDIANLEQLFGQRVDDIYDLDEKPNDPPIVLDHFKLLDGDKGSAPTVLFADITDLDDQDDYSLDVFESYSGSITFEIIVSGISQLSPRVVVTPPIGPTVGKTMAAGVDGSFTFDDVTEDAHFDIRVESGSQDQSGIGGYTLIVWFDNNLATPSAVYDLARVPIRYLDQEELGEFFEHGEQLFANDDDGQNDQPGFETELETAPGFLERTRYLQYASIDQVGDVDRYSLETPEGITAGNWARFSLRSVEGASFTPEMTITDEHYNPIQLEYLVHNSELTIVQFELNGAGDEYFVVVSAANDSQSPTGNYEIDAILGAAAVERTEFVSGQLSPQNDVDEFNLRLRRPQLFHFSFEVDATAPPETILRMTVVDQAGNELKRIETAAGDVRTGSVFLPRRRYRVIVETVSGSLSGGADYRVTGAAIDNPLGPLGVNTTGNPFDFDERVAIHIASIFGT